MARIDPTRAATNAVQRVFQPFNNLFFFAFADNPQPQAPPKAGSCRRQPAHAPHDEIMMSAGNEAWRCEPNVGSEIEMWRGAIVKFEL